MSRGMITRWLCGAGLGLALAVAAPVAQAQDRGDGEAVNELVEELLDLVDEAERQHAADPRFLDRLRQLAARYTWPWNVSVFADGFRDGDFTRDPAWRVVAGDFWIDRDLGLRTSVRPPTAGGAGNGGGEEDVDPAARILGTVLQEMLRQQNQDGGGDSRRASDPSAPAELFIERGFDNAFALEARVHILDGDPAGGLFLGTHQGGERTTGYVLALRPDRGRLVLELLRLRWGGSNVIASHEVALRDDSRRPPEHVAMLTRAEDGTMAVYWDGGKVIETVDRGITRGFKGVRIVNRGGSFGIRQVALDAARR